MTLFIQKSSPTFLKSALPAALAAMALSLTACSKADEGGTVAVPKAPETSAPAAAATSDKAGIDIGMLDGGRSVQSFDSPPGYQRDAKILTYEGPGWESDKVGYRLYLDGRNVLDIFGKKTPGIVLPKVGRGEDYHAMADWGMDILKVGNSLGAGGWGVFKAGKAVQVGNADSYSARVVEDTKDTATLEVTLKNAGECKADMTTTYKINAGERLTHINVAGDCARPVAAGIVIHPGTEKLASGGKKGWQYIARYGAQSLVPDNLGIALFYNASFAAGVSDDLDDSYVIFRRTGNAGYITGAAWAQEDGGITDKAGFQAWLTETQAALNASAK